METDITQHLPFLNCKGELLCQLIGGSTLYGLNNENSDIDYRGLFIATDKKYVAGLETIDSIVQTGEIDSTYYSLGRYIQLLRKVTHKSWKFFLRQNLHSHTPQIFLRICERKHLGLA